MIDRLKLQPELAPAGTQADAVVCTQAVHRDVAAKPEGDPRELQPPQPHPNRHLPSEDQRYHPRLLLRRQFLQQLPAELRLAGERHVDHRGVPVALVEHREGPPAELRVAVQRAQPAAPPVVDPDPAVAVRHRDRQVERGGHRIALEREVDHAEAVDGVVGDLGVEGEEEEPDGGPQRDDQNEEREQRPAEAAAAATPDAPRSLADFADPLGFIGRSGKGRRRAGLGVERVDLVDLCHGRSIGKRGGRRRYLSPSRGLHMVP